VRILCALPALLWLAACGGETPPPKKTVFDSMTRQEQALPAAVEQAQDAHMQELKRQEETATAPGR
jgi:hypothetical protein